ncbi:MAG: hypothetical protein NT061_05520 [Spirochaetes bacterium]|nr:hypothetical protein [Spirochaetota bacterium]
MMRKNSDRARHCFGAGLVFLLSLILSPASVSSQAAVLPYASVARGKLGVAAFIQLSNEARTAIDTPNPIKADLFSAAAPASGKLSPLTVSLSLLARSILELLPSPSDGGAELSSPSSDIPLFTMDQDALKACDRLIAGFYSVQDGQLVTDIYLVDAKKEQAEKLGYYSGSYANLEGYKKTLSQFLLPIFSANAWRIVDFSILPQGSSIALAAGQKDTSTTALLIGSRLFIYDDNNYDIVISRPGYFPQKQTISPLLNDIYNIIHIDLVIDPQSIQKGAEEELAAASAETKWDSAQKYEGASKLFSAALGRLVVSIPLTAICLGVFYLGYEGYSRSAVSETSLWLRGGAAAFSLGFSVTFAIDMSIRLERLISTAR